MNLARLLQFLHDRRKLLARLSLLALGLLVLFDAIPAFVDKSHAHTGAERFPGFWAVFGFVGCAVLIVASKWFGHLGIMRGEDFYEETGVRRQESGDRSQESK
jgi:hypothetical protein